MGPGGVATDPEKAGYVRFRTDENGGTLYIADAGGDFTKVAPGLTEVGASTASTWFTGSGAPAGGTGVVGDWYLDTATGELYQKTGASAWTLRATAWVPVTGGIRNIGMVGMGRATAPSEMLEVSANVAGTTIGSANLKMSYSASPTAYANYIRNVFSGTRGEPPDGVRAEVRPASSTSLLTLTATTGSSSTARRSSTATSAINLGVRRTLRRAPRRQRDDHERPDPRALLHRPELPGDRPGDVERLGPRERT